MSLNENGYDKVAHAIAVLRAFEPPDGYHLAFSGGKDSVCIKRLAETAGVKFDAHYNLTGIDPPELVRFIKAMPDVIIDVPRDSRGKRITMWSLIEEKKFPPTKMVRYCCEELKESGGKGRVTVTGVRWAESTARKHSQGLVTMFDGRKAKRQVPDMVFTETKRGGVVLNDDNSLSRRIVEQCYRTNKTLVNPIIDWETEDVWEFIHRENIPYCTLYDEGKKRLGCIGCPMATYKERTADFERYPKFKAMYMRAFDKMLKAMTRTTTWKSADDVFVWWMNRINGKKIKTEESENE